MRRSTATYGARAGFPARLSPARLTATGWAVGAIVTLVIALTPHVTFGFRSASGHVMLDSVDACVAALVAYLVYGRYVRYRRLQDVLLWQGLALLAVAGLVLTYLTEALTGFGPATLDVWLPLAVRVIGALVIAAAAMTGQRHAPVPRRAMLPLVATVAAGVLLWAVRGHLPQALDENQHPPSAQHPYFAGHWTLLAAQAASAVLFLVASAAFTRQARGSDDELLRWLGPGCALAGFARVNYLLYPSLYTDWLYAGDFLRTGCYLLLLVGASREIRQFWDARTRAMLAAERRRLAGELHDGVIQELGLIRAEAFSLPDGSTSKLIMDAAERAVDEARAAVHTLVHAEDEPLHVVLARAAADVADRHGLRVDVAADDSVVAGPEQRHALVRIVREAVSNAARHGGAQRVQVSLHRVEGRRCLSVRDDGGGFDVAAAERATGYGLISMRERAHGLPGALDIASRQGAGSVVTVTW